MRHKPRPGERTRANNRASKASGRTTIFLFLLLLAAPAQAQDTTRTTEALTSGSKKFTENVILGAMAAQLWEARGFRARHRAQLGGSRFLWEALRGGDIDAYPEYTGTLVQEILPESAGLDSSSTSENLRRELRERGVRMTQPLGFNNTYALGMKKARAAKLGIETISDLRDHPNLKVAFTNEFMDRGDGWPALRKAYDLPHVPRGVDHDIAYRGLRSGAVDVIDLYSTDAEIEAYDLRVLDDDRDFFTRYEAVYLYRAGLAERAPGAVQALRQLEGRIDAETMTRLNKRSKIDGVDAEKGAARFLNETILAGTGQAARADVAGFWTRLGQRSREHGVLVGLSLTLAVLLAVPLGVAAAKGGAAGQSLLLLVGLTYTVPSLALLALMVPPLGLGRVPAVTALFLYSLLPIVWNTYTGLRDIDGPTRASAEALGLSPWAKLRRVELPLAARSVLAGVKIAAVINVGTATLGALIGAGGYGQPILTGIRRADLRLILEGTIPAAVLTVLLLALLEGIERFVLPEGLRR
jgi:osmoprotectant transport system permease protein